MLEQVMALLPQALRTALLALPEQQLEEVRLRAGQMPTAILAGQERRLPGQTCTTQAELQRLVMSLSSQSQYAVQEQLRAGFLTMPGGYRVGVCGSTIVQDGRITGLRKISSLAIRIPHEIAHPPDRLLPYLTASCLIAGAPGSGKTTLLRSCIRTLSDAGQRVAVADERLELAGAVHGTAQFCLGAHTDILSGCPKAEGVMLLLRGMNPQWIAVDEITQPEDLAAIGQIAGCGVRLLATVHAGGREELLRKPLCRRLFSLGVFRQVLFLDKNRAIHAERIRDDETDRTEFDFDGVQRGRTETCTARQTAAGADTGDD